MPADKGGSTYSFHISLTFAYRKLEADVDAATTDPDAVDGETEVADVAS
jgi:hypothetical protein